MRENGGRPGGRGRVSWSVEIENGTPPASDQVSCQKGKPIRKAKPGDWRCKECGFVTAKKGKICEPKKVKK